MIESFLKMDKTFDNEEIDKYLSFDTGVEMSSECDKESGFDF